MWVIFDSGTKPQYYQDVHNLLALPSGTRLRYDYRTQYITPGAEAALIERKLGSVVLVYAQLRGYLRGQATPDHPRKFDDMVWVATRWADLVDCSRGTGEAWNLDLRVLDYPSQGDGGLQMLLKSLWKANETPFNKWVALADDLPADCRAGTTETNWPAICDELARSTQFSGDTFSRTKEIVDVRSNTPLRASKFGQLTMFEGTRYSCTISRHKTWSEPDDPVALETSTAPISVLSITDSALPLRRFGESSFVIDVPRTRRWLVPASCKLAVQTPEGNGDWPKGANLELRCEARKRKWQVVVAVLLFVLAIVSGAGARDQYNSGQSLLALLLLAAAVLVGVFSIAIFPVLGSSSPLKG